MLIRLKYERLLNKNNLSCSRSMHVSLSLAKFISRSVTDLSFSATVSSGHTHEKHTFESINDPPLESCMLSVFLSFFFFF